MDAGTANAVLSTDGTGTLSWQNISGTLSGGTINYLPKWTSSNTLSSTSKIYDDGTHVGIGTTTTNSVGTNTTALTISAADAYSGSKQVGLELRGSEGSSNTMLGQINFVHGSGLTEMSRIESRTGNTNITHGQLAFFTNYNDGFNERMRVSDEGNLGVGTSTPAELIQVSSSGASAISILSSATSSSQYYFGSSTNNYLGAIEYSNATNGMNFWTNNTPNRMFISNSGNVGIGLTVPASKFHVAGQIRTGIPAGGLGGAGAVTGSLLFYNSATTGTVNIQSGSTTTGYTLTLPTSVAAANNSSLISTTGGVLSWAAPGAAGAGLPTGTTGQTLRHDGANWISNSFLYNSGTNIGIGTTAPAELLELSSIDSDIDAETYSTIESSSFHVKRARGTVATPTAVLSGDYMGGVGFKGYSGSFLDGAVIEGVVDGTPSATSMPGRIEFMTTPVGSVNPATRMTIKNDGKVGIGTNAPSSSLEVVGDVEIPAANSYKYTTAKVNYTSLSSASFTTINALTVDGNATGNARWISSGVAGVTDNMFATVSLPNGATITDIDVYVYDADVTYEVSANLVRNNLLTNINSTLATTAGTGLAAAPGLAVVSATLSSVVDNSTYMYYLKFNTRQNNTNLWIRGAIVTYTVTKAD
jgi:hypothetical protein